MPANGSAGRAAALTFTPMTWPAHRAPELEPEVELVAI